MIRFSAVVRIEDVYGHDTISIDEIRKILFYCLEDEAGVQVKEVISIDILPYPKNKEQKR